MKKLLLASAIAAAATSATALEAMSDSAMSETTGQDGLTIQMNVNATADLLYIDRDGVAGATNAGALVMTNTITGDVTIDVDVATDAAGDGNSALVLGIAASSLDIGIGDISVDSIDAADQWATAGTPSAKILDAMDVTISNLDAQIALGDSGFSTGASGSTALADLALTIDTLTVTGISINDSDGYTNGSGAAGSLGIAQLDITGVSLSSSIDIDGTDGLVIEVGTLNLNARVTDLDINGTSIGDIALNNMVLSGTSIQISGH